MPGAESDDAIDSRLDAFGDEGLEHVAFDRQAQARHRRKPRGVAGDREPDLSPRGYIPRVVSTPAMRPLRMTKPVTSQFWMMSTPRRSAARA